MSAPESPTSEVRVVSATGGEKGRKGAELGAIDPASLLMLAEVAGFGSRKYARHNFLKGYPHSLSVDALFRHILADLSGQDLDEHRPDCDDECVEHSNLPHLAHAAWHCLAILAQRHHGVGDDDRFVHLEPAEDRSL